MLHRLLGTVRGRRPPVGVGLVLFLALNLVVVGAHFWSSKGQTTTVEMKARGGTYSITIDGRPVLPHYQEVGILIPAPETGTVRFRIPVELAALPGPNGLDSVIVRDPTGQILFQDDFDFFNTVWWEVLEGHFDIESGVLTANDARQANTVQLRDRAFGDHTLTVKYRNSRGGTIGTHVTEDGGVYYHFDLLRDFANWIDAYKDGQPSATPYGGLIDKAPGQTLRSITFMVTRPYPYLAAGLLLGLAVTIILGRLLPAGLSHSRRLRRLPTGPLMISFVIALFAFAATLLLNWQYYQFIPHTPDEVAYLFQGELLAHFRLTAPIPPEREAFYFYSPTFLYEHETQWAAVYPFGHPLALSLGAIFGAVGIVPSLIGAGNVVLTFLLGRRLYSATVGVLSAALLAMAPFFLMQSSNFMSHNTGAFYILASTIFMTNRQRPILNGLLAGVFFGLVANTRPINAVALVPAFIVLIALGGLKKDERQAWRRHFVAFLAGGALLAIGMAAYNYGITGDPLLSAYGGNTTADPIGFTAGHTFGIGLRNEQAQMMALLTVLHGWPVAVGLGFASMPFLLGTRNRWDYWLLFAAVAMMGIYILYRFSGVFAGPRYWFEAVPFLMLLTARGAEMAGTRLGEGAVLLRSQLSTKRDLLVNLGRGGTYVVMLTLAIYGSGRWALNLNEPQDAPLVPVNASEIKGIFDVDNRLDRLAQEQDLEHALVLVEPCGFFQSIHCYGTVFVRNLPNFDGDVVWARYVRGQNERIIEAFPGRDVYVASWDPEAAMRRYDQAVDH